PARMPFDPIAVVGRGCVLPDALDVDTLWSNVLAQRVSLSAIPTERWRLPADAPARIRAAAQGVGGYVTGFEDVFDPPGFQIPADELTGLDAVFHWVLHAGRQAMAEAGARGPLPHAGLVLGNLSFPTREMARYAEHVWGAPNAGSQPDARNRFSSGLPA